MDPKYSQFLRMYRFPNGRRAFVTREVARRASEVGAVDIAAQADQAVAHDSALYSKRRMRRYTGQRMYGPEATVADSNLDHCLVGYHSYLDSVARMFRGTPIGDAAAAIRDRIFPDGPGAIIRLPYASQHSAVEDILQAVDVPELAELGALIPQFPEMTVRLRQLHDAYGAALHKYVQVASSDEIRADEEIGQENLAVLVILILGHGLHGGPEQVEQQRYMLEPIMRQNQSIRRARRRRGAVRDIDPETGIEVPDEANRDVIDDEEPIAEVEDGLVVEDGPVFADEPANNESDTLNAEAARSNRRRTG